MKRVHKGDRQVLNPEVRSGALWDLVKQGVVALRWNLL